MAKQLAAPIRQRFYGLDGNVLSGGKLYSYQGGSARASKKNTYSPNGSVNTNPVVLDAAGEADIWIEGGPYLFVLCDANGVEIWARDNINNISGTGIDGANGVNGATASNATVGFFTGCAGQDLTSGGTKPAPDMVVTSGYNAIGQGGAVYVKDATVDAAFVTAHPRWSFRDSQGNGYRLAREQKVMAECFGAKGDSTSVTQGTDNYAAWLAAKDFIHYFRAFPTGNSYYKYSVPIHWNALGYYFSAFLDLTDAAYELFGSGSPGGGGGGGTSFFFNATCGVVLQSWDTAGVNTINQPNNAGTPHGASSSHIRDIVAYAYSGTVGAEQHGFLIKCTGVTLEKCSASHFGGNGIHVYANAPGAGNANNNNFYMCGGHNSGLNGVYVAAGDANSCIFIHTQANNNRKFGIAECSFLGNHWIAYHTAGNGMPQSHGCGPVWAAATDVPGSRVRSGGHTWYVHPGADVASQTTVPGTNAAVWVDLGTVDPGFAEAWVSGHKYASGGGVYIGNFDFTPNNNNRSVMTGYSEQDQYSGWGDSNCSLNIAGNGGAGPGIFGGLGAVLAGIIGSRGLKTDGKIINAMLGGIPNNNEFFQLGYGDVPNWKGIIDPVLEYVTWSWAGLAGSNPFYMNAGTTIPGMTFPRGLTAQNVGLTSATAVPTTGYYTRGWVVYNELPVAGGKAGWICITTGWVATTAWQASHAYNVGDLVTNDTGKSYRCITAGTSAASGGPTGTAADITDGSAHWAYSAGFAFKPYGAIDA